MALRTAMSELTPSAVFMTNTGQPNGASITGSVLPEAMRS